MTRAPAPDARPPHSAALFGRARELASISDAVRGLAGRREAQFLAIHGEPGIGKTRLLEELGRQARDQGQQALTGRGSELESELPFAIWADALEGYAHLDDDPGVERIEAYRAVAVMLEQLAPVVVVLDDLHWADEASFELLAHLLRRPPRAPVLIALGFRGLPAPLAGALEAAARHGSALDLPLAPLTRAEARAWLGASPALHRLSGGNPFYLLELTRHDGVPRAVAAAVGHEIAALGEPARTLAFGAAVAGDPSSLELAAAAAGLPEAAVLGALDEVVAGGLLVPAGPARRYRFRHPIVRRAVYEAAGEGWRLAAHARAAAALERRGGAAAARANHLARCAHVGDEPAITALVEAAACSAARAPATAARWFAAALRLLPEPRAAERRLALLVPLADALAAAGQLERALAALSEALALAEAPEQRTRLIAACAECEQLLGRHSSAHARLLRARAELPAAAALLVALAADALYDGDFESQAGYAREAAAADDGAHAAVARALLALALVVGGDPAAAAARDEAAALVDSMGDERLAERLDALYHLGFADHFGERDEDAIRHFRRGIAIARAAGRGQYLLPTMAGLATALERRGRLAEALATAETAVEIARPVGNRALLSWSLAAEASAAAAAGDRERATAAAEEAVALLAGLDDSVLTVSTRALAAAAFLTAGDPERCLEQGRRADLTRLDPGRRACVLAAMARAELALGDPAAAAEWAERAGRALTGSAGAGREADPAAGAGRAPTRHGRPESKAELAAHAGHAPARAAPEAAVLRTRALLALARGQAAHAAELAERAAARADAAGAVVSAAEARLFRGRALAQSGDRAGAIAVLSAARSELAAAGAHRLRDEAALELRRLGRRAAGRQRRGASGSGLAALSGREREIAQLVALGHSNREIAGELFLAEKTVEGHLTNVFVKLGVASRAAVAAFVAAGRPA